MAFSKAGAAYHKPVTYVRNTLEAGVSLPDVLANTPDKDDSHWFPGARGITMQGGALLRGTVQGQIGHSSLMAFRTIPAACSPPWQ